MEKNKIKIVYSKDTELSDYELVSGEVDLGYMGFYTTDKISVYFDDKILAEILDASEDNDYCFAMKAYFHEGMSKSEIAEALEKYYGGRIADIQKHKNELNQVFLAHLLLNIQSCGYPFWECTDYIIPEKMPSSDGDADLEDLIYSEEACAAVEELFNEIGSKPLSGEPDASMPAEDLIEKYFPMLDLKKLLADIYGEYLSFDHSNVAFQCSGKGQAVELVSGAYAPITAENTFDDWHNH